jgi:predicted secreted hydrolase
VAVLAVGAWVLGSAREAAEVRATLSVASALGDGGASGFAQAMAPRPFAFPADHGPHPGFRTEWWYYTGHLETATGRRFGFQLTFFRVGLDAAPAPRLSAWATSAVAMAHLAVTDVAGRRFHAFERLSRMAMGLAGAAADPFRVWVEDWSVEGPPGTALPMRLRAAAGEVGIDLTLAGGKPVVLQGERGLSRKSGEPGNASYYYSLTRMPARGIVRVGADELAVRGAAWMDREWSTSALGPDQVGWDWFALQLSDGREVMFYQLRRRDGGADPMSAGTVVAADGSTRSLAPEDLRIDVLASWTSPRGATYPARWRIAVPGEGIDVEATPLLADQELDLTVRYWEGAVELSGTAAGAPVTGRGYVELTGYGERGGRSAGDPTGDGAPVGAPGG